MKRSKALKVLGNDADHAVYAEWPAIIARDKTGAIKRTKRGHLEVRHPSAPRHSPEIERDSAIEVEPMPIQGPDGVCSDVEDHRRYVRLRAARALAGTWQPSPGPLPKTRADCDPARHEEGCRFPRCRQFLWRIEEPPGRPGLRNVPRDPVTGFTQRVRGDLGPRAAPSIVPRWLEGGRVADSCALDVADRGPHDNTSLGAIIGKHRTLTARSVTRALLHMRELGETARDIERLIDSHRAAANDHEAEPSRTRSRRG